MILGILSDTHGFFHPGLSEELADVDLLLHAGDVGTPDVLDRLESLGPPVRAVWGNIDDADMRRRLPEHQRFEVDGLRFWMTHIGGHPDRWDHAIVDALCTSPPDVFICGHSHILRLERVADLDDMLYVNPGAAGRQGFHQHKTCVRLTLDGGSAQQAEVVHLDASNGH